MRSVRPNRPVKEIIQEYQEQKTEALGIEMHNGQLFMNNYFYAPDVVYDSVSEEDIIKTVQYCNLTKIIVYNIEIFPESLTTICNHFHGTLIISDMLLNDMFLNSIKYLREFDVTYINKKISPETLDHLIEAMLNGKIGKLVLKSFRSNNEFFRDVEYYEDLDKLKYNRIDNFYSKRYVIEHEI